MYKTRTLGDIFEKIDTSTNYYDESKIISPLTAKNHKDRFKLLLSRLFNFNFDGLEEKDIDKFKFKLNLLNKHKLIINFLNSRYDSDKVKTNFINTIMIVMRLFGLHLNTKKPKIEMYDKQIKKNIISHPFIPSYQKYLDYNNILYSKIKDDKTAQIEKGDKNIMKHSISDEDINLLINRHLTKFNKNKKLKHLQDAIIIMLFTKQNPVRLDFNDMIITNDYDEDFKLYGDKYNYVDLTNNLFLILNFKTSSMNKEIIKQPLSDELKHHITVLFNNRNYGDEPPILLLDNNDEPMTAHYLGIKLKRLTGCSVNDFRHKTMTGGDIDNFVKEYRRLELMAKHMGTSVKTLINHYHS